jgi:hypothetical protein
MIGFDHVFCVNLDRRPDRWAEAQAELAACGISGCERFSAIYNPANTYVGCLQSHAALWCRIASGQFGERVLILEDDFKFLTREDLTAAGYTAAGDHTLRIFDSCLGKSFAERWGSMRSSVPDDWDLLYLGGGYETAARYRVNKYIIRNAGMLTTHAYGISRSFAQRAMETLAEGGFVLQGGPDSFLATMCKDETVRSYTLSPRLFIQRPGSPSDLNPNAPGFPFSMTDPTHEMAVGG